ncbi:sirohydrochlorin chelatase [Cohnella silvisoli]|uniref:CbiX/SirB N-terminal domain-containing protein n=1 Tax=Cohnella silvisoli TaxID=2873699 RepID=A0ABV1KQP1_9BACL|nr:CbiX/SirB N-terminal domain-containing protein [Cohnella silvisoli]MCD9024627.1 cobalamin biosynthesis protein CbiX [Cohnella silvisoli]
MKPGLLVISHGSREPGWVALVDATLEAARAQLGASLEVEAAFLELVEGRLIQDGIDRLEASGVTHLLALPLFVSSGSTHVDEIGWALGAYDAPRTETDLECYRISAELTYGKPMNDDPELVGVVLDRLKEMSTMPAKESFLLIGHGSQEAGFQEAWEQGLAAISDQLMRFGGFGACSTALLLPNQVKERWQGLHRSHPHNDIIVIALFLSEGYFTKEVIPRRLEGLACRYDGRALMPHPRIADWIVRQTRDWLDPMES